MLGAGLFDEGIETAGTEITFDLPIPEILVERCEPLAEATKIRGGELADSSFDLFDTAHGFTLPPPW